MSGMLVSGGLDFKAEGVEVYRTVARTDVGALLWLEGEAESPKYLVTNVKMRYLAG